MADINPDLPDPTLVNRPRRKAWFSRIRRLLFLAVLTGMGVGLHVMLPPAPRWTIPSNVGILSADGKTLTTLMIWQDAGGDRHMRGPLQTWDTSTGQMLASFPENSPFFLGMGGQRSFLFDGRNFAVVLDDKRAALGDVQTGRERTITLPTKQKPDTFPLNRQWLKLADQGSPLSHHFVFQEGGGSENNPVQYHVVEASTGELLATLSGFAFPGQPSYYVDYSNINVDRLNIYSNAKEDDLICYFAPANDGPLLTVWSIKERRIVRTLPELKWTAAVAHSRSPYRLLTGGKEFLARNRIGDSKLFRWDFWNLQTGARRSLTSASELYPVVAPNGLSYVFLTESCFELWDAKDLQRRAMVPSPGLADIEFSADSRFLGVVVFDGTQFPTFSVWDIETATRLWEKKADAPQLPELLISPDSQFVMHRKRDLELEIRESVSGKVHWCISFTEPDVSGGGGQFIAAGEYLAYGSDRRRNGAPNTLEQWLGAWYPFPKWRDADGIVMVGHIATRKEICRLRTDPNLHVSYLSPDGRTLITSCGEDTENAVFQAWDLPPRPRWGWVLGAPAGLLACVLLMKRLFAWRARKRTPVIAPQ